MFITNIKHLFILISLITLMKTVSIEEDFKIPKEYISDQEFLLKALITHDPIKIIYASPDSNSKECTETNPCSLETAISKLQKGYTLYLKEGTYDVKSGIEITEEGSSNSYITISSAPGETAIITSSLSKQIGLFQIYGSYLIIENLNFKDVTAKNVQGIVFYGGGQNHIIIRNNIFDSLKTTKIGGDYGANGILLMGEETDPIKQIFIYGNTLTNNVLGYSEGISIAGNCEEVYVIKNTLKKNTNIGIDFYGNAGYCQTASLDQPRKCVATLNYVSESISPYADCAGLYIDGAKDIFLGYNTIENSQYGIEIGSEERKDDYPVKNIVVKENILNGNSVTGLRIGGFDEEETGVVKDTSIENNQIIGSNTAVIIAKSDNITFSENQINAEKYFIDMEFDENYIKNIKFVGNTFTGKGSFRMYGSTKLSLDEFLKKYSS